jgi:hypothetical protein
MANTKVIGTGTTLIKKGNPAVGGWLSAPSVRKRKGLIPTSSVSSNPEDVINEVRPNAILSNAELWSVYRRTPDVRASIDSIVRRVATFDWTVEPTVPATSDLYLEALDIANRTNRFLSAPNKNGETWQELMTATLTDLLVFDAGAIEVVFDSKKELKELVALPGTTIRPVLNEHGRLLRYVQDMGEGGAGGGYLRQTTNGSPPIFKPDELVMLQMFTNTQSGGYGNPLIESLVNEVITLIRGSEHIMMAYDADEIPPGILVLAGLAGNAAREARADLQNMRGQDHKIRVLTTPDPAGAGAKWVELRHTPKDLEFESIMQQIRRTVWRVFGVMPVEMGASDALPRSTAQIQLDVASSHLVTPILELLQAKVNARIIPLVVGDSDLSKLVTFKFDRSAHPTAEDSQYLSQSYQRLVGIGVMTRNEVRKEIGLLPILNGDVPTVDTAQGPVPLDILVKEGPVGALTIEEPSIDDEITSDVSQQDIDAIGDEAPGEVELSNRAEPSYFGYLPSEWQPEGFFSKYRTIGLERLGFTVAQYAKFVQPYWREARDEIVSSLSANYKDGKLSEASAAILRNEVGRSVDKLATKWGVATYPLYIEAAKIAHESASKYVDGTIETDYELLSKTFNNNAMFYLTNSEGLLGVMKTKMIMFIDALVGNGAVIRTNPKTPKISAPKGVEPGMLIEEMLESAIHVWDSQENRIENWSGKLVELSNIVAVSSLSSAVPFTQVGGGDEWYYEWVEVGDNRTCATCRSEGTIGFRALSQIKIYPGGGTVCGARCRCVLVFWKKSEIDSGVAKILGPADDE